MLEFTHISLFLPFVAKKFKGLKTNLIGSSVISEDLLETIDGNWVITFLFILSGTHEFVHCLEFIPFFVVLSEFWVFGKGFDYGFG